CEGPGTAGAAGARSDGFALQENRAKRGVPHRCAAAARWREGPVGEHVGSLRKLLSAAGATVGDSVPVPRPAGGGGCETRRAVPKAGGGADQFQATELAAVGLYAGLESEGPPDADADRERADTARQ